MSIALVDFGNTMADETFMRRDCDRFPSWSVDYVAVVDQLRVEWDTGRLSSHQLAAAVATRLGSTVDEVHEYMLEQCRAVSFYEAINEALRRRRDRGGKQALVTVNPDLFTEIVAHYRLHEMFDVVVGSWQYGTDSKVELCRQALDLLGAEDPSDTILIDNIDANVEGWVAHGGHGYLFQDDPTFASDVRDAQIPGFLPTDVAARR